MILGRDPGRRGIVQEHLNRFETLEELRQHLLRTPEFLRQHAELVSAGRNPGLDLAAEKLVLMHIPKTAGTSLTAIVDQHFKSGQIFPDQLQLRGYSAMHLGRYRLFRGHFPLRDIQYIPGQRFIFTLLREPRARLLSQYRYHRARRPELSLRGSIVERAKLPLKEYLSHPAVRSNASVDNIQCRYLFYLDPHAVRLLGLRDPEGTDFRFDERRTDVLEIAKANLARLGGFGLAERFDDSVALLAAARGLPAPRKIAPQMVTRELAQVNPADYEAVEIDPPDTEAAALMDDLVALDEPLYAYAVALFEERMRALDTSARPLSSALVSAK
jgi:hypothetical protein